MRRTPRIRSRAAIATLALAMLATGASSGGARRHTRLLRSVPAQDSVVNALPQAMQLWFSEPIELGVSRVRLEGADAKAIPLTPLAKDAARADAPVTAPIPPTLADGRYTVQWTVASKDGHVVSGSFAFTLKSR